MKYNYSDYPILDVSRAIKRKAGHLYFIDSYLFGKKINVKRNYKYIGPAIRFNYEKLCLIERIKFKSNFLETFSFWMFKYYFYNDQLFKELGINEKSFSPSGILLKKNDYVKIKYNLVNKAYIFNFIDFVLFSLKLDKLSYEFYIQNKEIIIFDYLVTDSGIKLLSTPEFRKIIYSLNTSRILFSRRKRKEKDNLKM